MYYTTFSIKSWIPDWNDIIGGTYMTSFFFLDPSSQATRMTPYWWELLLKSQRSYSCVLG
ncbi:hypothetical protein [Wolbachia endosymbiont of Aedes albopictus]|uniref:hypothetical protein n=1 Tax=Wolbachia endosymbiont of Aedes albopictus TaxID=167957 RepID=UPI00216740F5|nr:hypothetical protein [Wolbachia endosymbiont of Aedes albopictus]UVW83888.1 hypothetical protein NHG98_06110 [Wolbachia endosymbiont of Aedes albopictus]